MSLEAQLQVFNVFNRVNFNPISGIGSVPDNYQITAGRSDANSAVDQQRTMQMAFRIRF